MVLEANHDVLASLRRYYLGLMDLKEFPDVLKLECSDDIANFASHIDSVMYEFKMQVSRAKLLAGIISDRKGLVCNTHRFLTNGL